MNPMRSLSLFLATLLFTAAAAAQTVLPTAPVPPPLAPGYATLTETELRTDLSYIASDKLLGRMSLQPGDDEAARWVAEQFRKAGLQPAATDTAGKPSFLQPFTLVEYSPDRPATTVTLKRAGRSTVFHAPQAFGAYKQPVDLTAPVVFAGFGITAPELGYDDYRTAEGNPLDVTGKIVLIFDHEPQEDDPHSVFNGTGNTRYATARVKLLNAQRHGAVAVVIVAEPNRKHLTNAERSARIGGSITRATPLPAQAIQDDEIHIPSVLVLDAVADTLLEAAIPSYHVPEVQSSASAHSGLSGQFANAALPTNGQQMASFLQSAIDNHLTPMSFPLPDTVLTLHLVNITQGTGTTLNVAGLLPGSDPKLAPETVIISAHHDHDGWAPCPVAGAEVVRSASGSEESPKQSTAPAASAPVASVSRHAEGGIDQNGKPTSAGSDCEHIWHGADDNGSGTVGVVALARAFAANPVKPKRSILFVVFASEERGLLGSYWMAAHPLRPLATTRAMINFDMIGRDEKPSPQTEGLITIPADTSNRLNLIGALYSPTYNAVVAEENRHVGLVLDDRFDHESALNVFFRSDQFPFVLHDVPAFWWFTGFHPDYHHITDTIDKIDFPKMRRILDLAYLSAFRFADDAITPVFIANPKPAQ